MDAARGGMPEPHTCMLPFLNLTLIVVVFSHCWNSVDASSLLYEPPYTEPYVRWCGRTAEVTPPPTRFKSVLKFRVHPWLNFSFSDRLRVIQKAKSFSPLTGPT